MLPWYFVPLLTVSAVTGVRTQRQEARTCLLTFGVPGIQKSTWIWVAHLLDVTAMKEKTPPIIHMQRKTQFRGRDVYTSSEAAKGPSLTESALLLLMVISQCLLLLLEG